MVSYESKKNGRQEGSYKGATAFFDSYAAYRAPPTTKPRTLKFSNEEAVKLYENGRQSRNSIERNSTVPIPLDSSQRNGLTKVNSFNPNPRLAYVQSISDSFPNTVYRQPVTTYQTEFLYQIPQNSYQLIQHSSYEIENECFHTPQHYSDNSQYSQYNSLSYNKSVASSSQISSKSLDSYSQSSIDRSEPSRYPQNSSQYSSSVHHNHPVPGRPMSTNSAISKHISPKSNDDISSNHYPFCSIKSSKPLTSSSGSKILSPPLSPSKIVKQQYSVVNPALLSQVSESFRARITLSNRMKDNLEYKDCFDGREAVGQIAFIIKTTDRNLALLLGRALDSQKIFHDVTYDHRLRDSQNELYQFRKMPSILSPSNNYGFKKNEIDDCDENDLPTGVFTLLTDCYSPTCTRDNLCYSIACPRRLEQHARKHKRPNLVDLSRSNSRGSIADRRKDQKLWAHTVPPEIAHSVSEVEKKRQEAINELIYTEKDFVNDIEYLRDCWMLPLLSQNIIPELRREKFVIDIFFNIMDIYCINSKLSDALQKRQNSYAIVGQIGDIFLENVPKFSPYIGYGAHQLWGKYYFENEKNNNPAFAKFVEETERLPESRKLELNGYLTKPTTRLGRYPLLLEAILRQTPKNHPDSKNLPRVINLIKECLTKVNAESGKSENRFNLQQLNDQLILSGNEDFDLKLTEEKRQLIFKGSLKRANESSDLQVFLFDHALLMVKVKIVNKTEQYKIYRRPIPIELLRISTEDVNSEGSRSNSRLGPILSPTITRGNNNHNHKYPITFSCLGKKGFTENLYAMTLVNRKRWCDLITKQREIITKNKS